MTTLTLSDLRRDQLASAALDLAKYRDRVLPEVLAEVRPRQIETARKVYAVLNPEAGR